MEATEELWTKDEDELYSVTWYMKELPTIIRCGKCDKEFHKHPSLSGLGNRCPYCGIENIGVLC